MSDLDRETHRLAVGMMGIALKSDIHPISSLPILPLRRFIGGSIPLDERQNLLVEISGCSQAIAWPQSGESNRGRRK